MYARARFPLQTPLPRHFPEKRGSGKFRNPRPVCCFNARRHFTDERVPDRGPFPDIRVGRPFHYGDPDIHLPGKLELVVMNMDAALDPRFDVLRFVSVRVMKSREGGFVAVTCLHGEKDLLRKRLEELVDDPDFLVERVEELSRGLPEETNPDVWR
jgi:hypothetical protein